MPGQQSLLLLFPGHPLSQHICQLPFSIESLSDTRPVNSPCQTRPLVLRGVLTSDIDNRPTERSCHGYPEYVFSSQSQVVCAWTIFNPGRMYFQVRLVHYRLSLRRVSPKLFTQPAHSYTRRIMS